MKKLLATMAACIALTGCVTTQENQLAKNHATRLDLELSSLHTKLERGEISQTKFYELAYQRSLENNKAPYVNRYRLYLAEMVPVARQFDAGQISRAQFEDETRKQKAAMISDMEREKQSLAAQRDAQQAAAMRNLAISQQLMNMNRPQPPAFAPQINCRSTAHGGTVYTNCN